MVRVLLPKLPATASLIDDLHSSQIAVSPLAVPPTSPRLQALRDTWVLSRTLQNPRPALIHVVLPDVLESMTVVASAWMTCLPYVLGFQSVPPTLRLAGARGGVRRRARRMLFRAAAARVTVSRANVRRLAALFGMRGDEFGVIPPGIDVARFAAAPGMPRNALDLPGPGPVVMVVARLSAEKGLADFLRAASLVGTTPRPNFVLVGDGPLRPELERQAIDLGLAGRVVFLGYRRDIPALLAGADVIVLPSLHEGLPLAVLEALAVGRPVVATAVDGTAELIDHESTGLLVRPGNPAELAEAIIRVLNDASLRERLGRHGRARAAAFDQSAMIDRTVHVYERVIRHG
jgi:glycosyltransferase involved in cell wall biosynthesis